MIDTIKKLLPWLLALATMGTAASLVRLNQIRGNPTANPTILLVRSDGTLQQGSIIGMTVDQNGLINIPSAILETIVKPTIVVSKVSAAGQNAFPTPPDKTVCLVLMNGLAQSVTEDYSLSTGNIVSFNVAPQVGDLVQLFCF